MALDVGDAALNIDETLDAFLAEQRQRLSPRTYRNYEEVVEVFRRCMNAYGHSSLTGDKLRRWEERHDSDDHAYDKYRNTDSHDQCEEPPRKGVVGFDDSSDQ